MRVYKNIDVVQINVKAGVREYYLPKSVSWADKIVKNIFVYAAYPDQDNPDYKEISPVDCVTKIMDYVSISNVFFDLYDSNGNELVHNLSGKNLAFTNNNPIDINSALDLQLSRIFFSIDPRYDMCLLLYVSWDSIENEIDDLPKHSVTSIFELKHGSEVLLSDMIDSYIHAQGAKVRGVSFYGDFVDGGSKFITLRNVERNTILNKVPLNMCRPPLLNSEDRYFEGAERYQVNPIYLDREDIDFANSYIQDTSTDSGSSLVKLTFTY